MKTVSNKKKKNILVIGAVFLAALFCITCLYLNNGYSASEEALRIAEEHAVAEQTAGRDVLFFIPENAEKGGFESALVFYPGGKVQAESYAPLCRMLADRGILCALVKMPFDLAIFDADASGDVITFLRDRYQCRNIYLGGHSLGGVMASYFASENPAALEGILFFASYPDKDLSNTSLRALSVYGTEDKVLSMDSYASALALMPSDFTEVVLPGGCHAYFGSYGAQTGDGTPAISREEQMKQTADLIAEWIQTNR